MTRARTLPAFLIVLTLCFPYLWADRMSMPAHIKLQSSLVTDEALGSLPSLNIDAIQAEVPVNDRMNGDDAFSQPFLPALKEGMTWYLSQRGLHVGVNDPELRLVGTITAFEGWKGWGRWGADVTMQVRLFRGSQVVLDNAVRSFLKYSDEEDVEEELEPAYRAMGRSSNFTEILFTRLGVDLCEKLILLLKEDTPRIRPAGPGDGSDPAVPASAERGILSVEATELHAEVVLDGALVGTTPLADFVIDPGDHLLEVQKKGFKSWSRRIRILAGGRTTFVAELVRGADNE